MLGSRWGAAGAPRAARDEGGVFSTSDSSLGGGLCCALLATGTGVPSGPCPVLPETPEHRAPRVAIFTTLVPQESGRGRRPRRRQSRRVREEPAQEKGAPACPRRGTFRASPAPDGKLGTCCKAKLPKALMWTSTRTAPRPAPRAKGRPITFLSLGHPLLTLRAGSWTFSCPPD